MKNSAVVKVIFAILFTPIVSYADCSEIFKDAPITSQLADSGAFANVRGSAASLRVVSKELIMSAVGNSSTVSRPEGICPDECKIKNTPEVVFTSSPNTVKANYEDEKVCEDLRVQTIKKPIEYNNKAFNTLEELNTYYSDLCRGAGEDGEALYKTCHSSCSPTYDSVIIQSEGKYTLNTKVVCGHARDKTEGMYKLSTFYRWRCEPA